MSRLRVAAGALLFSMSAGTPLWAQVQTQASSHPTYGAGSVTSGSAHAASSHTSGYTPRTKAVAETGGVRAGGGGSGVSESALTVTTSSPRRSSALTKHDSSGTTWVFDNGSSMWRNPLTGQSRYTVPGS